MPIDPRQSRMLATRSEVIKAGQDAAAAAEKAARDDGKSDEEVEVAGKNASLEARRQKIAELAEGT